MVQAADLVAAAATLSGVVGDRYGAQGQGLELSIEMGLASLDDDVGGVLGSDQELGKLALAVEGVGGNHSAGQLQRRQQRPACGDLVGLAFNGDLAKHG